MRPILFVVPGWEFKIHSYGVMILLACFAALAMASGGRGGRRSTRTSSTSWRPGCSWAASSVRGGSTSLTPGIDPQSRRRPPELAGGQRLLWLHPGGLTGSILYWFRRPFPFWRMTDVAAPAVAIGIAIGRIGCFLNGCCYGAVCALPWAVRFPAGSHAWARQVDAGLISPWRSTSLPVHPTQLYASLAGFVVARLAAGVFPSPSRAAGEVMAVLMIVYPLTRWPLEALRGDEPAIFAGMTLSQNISVALLRVRAGASWLRPATGSCPAFTARDGGARRGAVDDRPVRFRSSARSALGLALGTRDGPAGAAAE